MIGLDTNVLVRHLVGDDAEQAARTEALIDRSLARGERLFVPQIVLCELVWVLGSVYCFEQARIVAVLRDLMRARQLVIEDLESAQTALDRFATQRGDFADHLIVARCRAAGCDRVASFDRALASDMVFSP